MFPFAVPQPALIFKRAGEDRTHPPVILSLLAGETIQLVARPRLNLKRRAASRQVRQTS
jgi:hypothetical protein